MTDRTVSLVIHGGAGPLRGGDYSREVAHMRGLIEAGRDRLNAGAPALDVVQETIVALEVSGLYVAGRGASPNTDGVYELDASLMHGPSRRLGAVAALVGFKSPITAARAVMEKTPHVMLAGQGAAAFAARQGLEAVDDPAAWFTHAWRGAGKTAAELATGTVGCLALDQSGALAAGTSTGGAFGKLPGRVGDSPIAGAGVWADDRVAVSCTGSGEMFIRAAVAAQIAHRVRFAGAPLGQAAEAALAEVAALGGEGGLIALSATGELVMPYNSAGMKRAALYPDGRIVSDVFQAGS
ncbi:MAG: L-asparaginase [Caulobacteraceae bacterium]|nr:L-asparaginase [Caulobacteraceae bacterium]